MLTNHDLGTNNQVVATWDPGPTTDEVTNAGTSRSAMDSADFQQLGTPLRFSERKIVIKCYIALVI